MGRSLVRTLSTVYAGCTCDFNRRECRVWQTCPSIRSRCSSSGSSGMLILVDMGSIDTNGRVIPMSSPAMGLVWHQLLHLVIEFESLFAEL